jgi:predicted nuclease of predicted toxin-antitoxin system
LRLLLDQHYDPVIAQELRRRGIDAVAVQGDRPDLEGQDDEILLRAAAAERRVMVTNNVRDFAPLVEDFGLRGETHYGVVLTNDSTFPRSKAGVGLLIRALSALVEDAPDDDLLDSCMYLPAP